MPLSLIDLPSPQPTLVPSHIPEISDDECVRRLAKAVEAHDSDDLNDSDHLDEVARLIGRLAAIIE